MQVYKVTNIVNGKIYVGQDSFDRSYYLGSGKLIRKAIKKYGKENFQKEILENCNSKEQLDEKEIYWIEKLNSTDLSVGYNIRLGGEGIIVGTKLDNDHKLHISQSLKNKWKNYDFKIDRIKSLHTPERNTNIGNSLRGRKQPLSVKKALSDRKLDKEKHFSTSRKKSARLLDKEESFWKNNLKNVLDIQIKQLIEDKYFNRIPNNDLEHKSGLSASSISRIIHKTKKILL